MAKGQRHRSNSKPPDARAANSDNDGDDVSHLRQAVLQHDLRDAPPTVMAERETELNERTLDFALGMAKAGVPWEDIFEMYGESFDPDALSRVVDEAERRHGMGEGGAEGQCPPFESPKWQDYDPKRSEKAAGKAKPDTVFNDYKAPLSALSTRTKKLGDPASTSNAKSPLPRWSEPSTAKAKPLVPLFWDTPSTSKEEPLVSVVDATFVRALKDSDVGSKPSFAKGDILRIIGHKRRGDQYFHILPLKPPGEVGRELRSSFEAADQDAVDEVGREARTEEEKAIFRVAVEWEG